MIQNAWFRLYHEFATDPKIQMMSEALQRRFIMLLCLRCSNGDVTLHDDEVAFQLRISNDEWADTKATFLAKNLISDDNTPTAWEKRQFLSDSSSERVRRHREKKKRGGNVTVTPPDTDTDTDTELKPPCAPAEKPADAPAPNPKAPEPSPPSEIETEFEQEFWPTYPNHKGKQQALKAFKTFRKRNPGRAKLDHILADIEDRRRRCADWLKADGQFVPMASTYLNNRRWLDPIVDNVSQLPASRHLGFDKIDYTEGLTKNADGSYNF